MEIGDFEKSRIAKGRSSRMEPDSSFNIAPSGGLRGSRQSCELVLWGSVR